MMTEGNQLNMSEINTSSYNLENKRSVVDNVLYKFVKMCQTLTVPKVNISSLSQSW